jgi:hypothetical protein
VTSAEAGAVLPEKHEKQACSGSYQAWDLENEARMRLYDPQNHTSKRGCYSPAARGRREGKEALQLGSPFWICKMRGACVDRIQTL